VNFEKYNGLCADITTNLEKWLEYCLSYTVVEDPLPKGWRDKLDAFDKLLIIKIFRPEKILFAIQDYVTHQLGAFFMEGTQIDMNSIYKDSDRKTPIIFVLS